MARPTKSYEGKRNVSILPSPAPTEDEGIVESESSRVMVAIRRRKVGGVVRPEEWRDTNDETVTRLHGRNRREDVVFKSGKLSAKGSSPNCGIGRNHRKMM